MSRPASASAGVLPDESSLTPAMRQFFEAKRQYRSAIVFFRMGDFYEMFYEDAVVAARALDLTLTSRSKDQHGVSVPMCGVPWHAAEPHIARLVRKGYRVAVCEQTEDPKTAKGVVRREVVRVVSPGTLADRDGEHARESVWLMALAPPADGGRLRGAALLDLSTGEFSVAQYDQTAGGGLEDDLATLRPREVIVAAEDEVSRNLPALATCGAAITEVDAWHYGYDSARDLLLAQLRAGALHGFGLDRMPHAVAAAGALLRYARDTQKAELAHVRSVRVRERAECLLVDPTTLKHLAVIEGADGGRSGSLLDEVDRTVTAMAGRQLRTWLTRPAGTLERVRERLDAVEELVVHTIERGHARHGLGTVQDLERLVSRVALATAGPRDLIALGTSLTAIPRVRHVLASCEAPLTLALLAQLDDCADLRAAIEDAIASEPPALTREGGFIRDGVDPELDALRGTSRTVKQVIAGIEERERARTGIASLKVRFNRVFGYYIEVSRANLGAVPRDYQRKQTVAGGERFITPELKSCEERVLGADERGIEREIELFEALRSKLASEAPRLLDSARALAGIDVLCGLAETAALGNYTKPHVHEGDELSASDVRHPVVERLAGSRFVPNDVELNGTDRQLVLLTGPNMGGKSTYLRQVALLTILAQAGSFVPARNAKLALVDRVYARVGASDNIARGQSTFMVEMQETALILNGATSRSLVVLDEIGRGTATLDGLSLATAVAEHLVTNPRARPKTLFATHYHELTDLASSFAGIVNAHVAVREWNDDIVFLHKILPGRSDRSYGIQVARLAGLPASVIARAREILHGLELNELARGGRAPLQPPAQPEQQLGLFQALPVVDEALRTRLRETDLNQTTPLAALQLLAELKAEAERT